MDQKSNAVILARVSSKAQEDEGYSLDSQLKLLQTYCQSKGLHVVRTFKIAETASKDQGRKIFHEMLGYISKSRYKIYHLAVEKTDRFTRNFRDSVAIDDWLEKDTDRRLHAVKENILLHKEAKSDVKFMWNIHVSVAKKYADNLREESMKGWAEKLAQGWMPAPAPPGYKTVVLNGKRVHAPDETTRYCIEKAFRLYLEPSHSIATITHELKVLGIRTHKGREYHKSQVQHILSNPYYIGVNRFDGKEYPGAQEPIISRELFEKVQQKMHKGRPTVMKKHNPPLKNLITCKQCGGVVTWQLQKGHYYGSCQRDNDVCRRQPYLRQDKVEAVVMDSLRELVCPSAKIIEWVAQHMRERHASDVAGRERQRVAFQTQVERLKRMDDALYDDKLAGDISAERYKQKHQQLLIQIGELEVNLSKIEAVAGQQLDQQLVLLELSQKAADLYKRKSPEQKRLIIMCLFRRLVLDGDDVIVEYTSFARAIADSVRKTNNKLGLGGIA